MYAPNTTRLPHKNRVQSVFSTVSKEPNLPLTLNADSILQSRSEPPKANRLSCAGRKHSGYTPKKQACLSTQISLLSVAAASNPVVMAFYIPNWTGIRLANPSANFPNGLSRLLPLLPKMPALSGSRLRRTGREKHFMKASPPH
ncbi:hypothetical protein Barb7_02118 [Bacteroidales bacterium Barb7]|nr:hypothetical protein Barb7_02118 [Bacteroidales bacterium Barb7]